jgi:hypothetical protein
MGKSRNHQKPSICFVATLQSKMRKRFHHPLMSVRLPSKSASHIPSLHSLPFSYSSNYRYQHLISNNGNITNTNTLCQQGGSDGTTGRAET